MILIPVNMDQFVWDQVPMWIESALTAALEFTEQKHYTILDGRIVPVDYDSTGIVQASTNWDNGLHQYLELKHGLALSEESLTSNFLSHRGFFSFYGPNIFGLTGTAGKAHELQALALVYGVDVVKLPPRYERRHYGYHDVVVPGGVEQWRNEVMRRALQEANANRGVLVLCETIGDVELLEQKLRAHLGVAGRSRVKSYKFNDRGEDHNVDDISPGQIIVATNLAGRGTDIKADSVERHGGLHVIVTFPPLNERVDEQNFGRTSRQGNSGTYQLVVQSSAVGGGDIDGDSQISLRSKLARRKRTA